MSTPTDTQPQEPQDPSATRPEAVALGSRENWWGEDPDLETPSDGTGHQCAYGGTSKLEYLAHRLLVDGPGAVLISGPALEEQNIVDELTEPCLHVPRTTEWGHGRLELSVYPHRKRYGEETGHIGGVVIRDRPREQFVGLVDDVLGYAREAHDVRPKTVQRIRTQAGRWKADEDLDDVTVMERVLRLLEAAVDRGPQALEDAL